MKKLKKFFLRGLAIMLILAALVVSVNAFFGSKEKTLRVMWWGSQTRHDKTLKVIEMFEAKNPKIKVEPIFTSFSGYFEKLITLSAGNQLPDVYRLRIQDIPSWASKGQVADLKNVSTLKGLSGMDKSTIDVGKYDGTLYGAATGVNSLCFAYNADAFKKAGVSIPDDTKWTWDDFVKICNTIYSKTKVWGTGNFAQEQFEIFARSKGETLYAPDLKSVGFTAKTFEEYMTIVSNLEKSNGMEPLSVALESASNEEASSYAKGKAAMRPIWSNKVIGVTKTTGKDSNLLMYPGPNNAEGMYVKPSMFMCIAETSKIKKEAGTFIRYFLFDEEANSVIQGDLGVPAIEAVRKSMKSNLDSQNKIIFDFISKVGKFSKKAMDPYFPPKANEARDALRDSMEEVSHGASTPAEAGKKAIEKMNSILQR